MPGPGLDFIPNYPRRGSGGNGSSLAWGGVNGSRNGPGPGQLPAFRDSLLNRKRTRITGVELSSGSLAPQPNRSILTLVPCMRMKQFT